MSWTAFSAHIEPLQAGIGKAFESIKACRGLVPITPRSMSVRHAADPADRDDEADQSGNQQPGTAFDGHQNADPEDDTHPDPNSNSAKQFHGGHVTRLGRRFKPSVSRGARFGSLCASLAPGLKLVDLPRT